MNCPSAANLVGMAGYGEDLAYIHDVGHGDFARDSAPGILGLLRRHRIDSEAVVELGCGSGILAAELASAGYDVLGVDISPAMIDLARQRVPGARFVCSSFLDVEIPACSAVLSVGECLGYLLDEKNGPDSLRGLFERVYESLRPGGVFVFDFLDPGAVGPSPIRRFREGEGWAVIVELTEDPDSHRLTRQITSFRRVGQVFRRGHETHAVQLYRPADLARALREIGFHARHLRGYGDCRFRPHHAGLLARKP